MGWLRDLFARKPAFPPGSYSVEGSIEALPPLQFSGPVDFKAGDVVVLSYERWLSDDQRTLLAQRVREALPNVAVLLLDGGLAMQLWRQEGNPPVSVTKNVFITAAELREMRERGAL